MQVEEQVGSVTAVDGDRPGEADSQRLDEYLVVAVAAVDHDRVDTRDARRVRGLAGGGAVLEELKEISRRIGANQPDVSAGRARHVDRLAAGPVERDPVDVRLERETCSRCIATDGAVRVRVVGPGRPRHAAVGRDPGVVAEVVVGPGAVLGVLVLVGDTVAHQHVDEVRTAVDADAGEVLDLGVAIAVAVVDVAGTAGGAEVVARVVPGQPHGVIRRVDREIVEELAVRPAVGVDPHRCAPGGPVIVGRAHEDVEVVAFVRRLVRVGDIETTVVRPAAAIVRDIRARKRGAVGCGR